MGIIGDRIGPRSDPAGEWPRDIRRPHRRVKSALPLSRSRICTSLPVAAASLIIETESAVSRNDRKRAHSLRLQKPAQERQGTGTRRNKIECECDGSEARQSKERSGMRRIKLDRLDRRFLRNLVTDGRLTGVELARGDSNCRTAAAAGPQRSRDDPCYHVDLAAWRRTVTR